MSATLKFLPITSVETLEKCRNLNTSSSRTIFIASYPKSGTTWMQWIVFRLLHPNYDVSNGFHVSKFAPFFEIDPTWKDGDVTDDIKQNQILFGRKAFNTHLPWYMMPKPYLGDNMKYIYLVRNGRDVCTSFFHHLSNQADNGSFDGTFIDFVQKWTLGEIPFGLWVEHLREWMLASKDPSNNIVVVRFEEMKDNLTECLRKISIGLDISLSDEMIDKILPELSFDYMKSNLHLFQPISVSWKEGFEFIRKGVVGDSENCFTPECDDLFQTMIDRAFPDKDWPDWLIPLVA